MRMQRFITVRKITILLSYFLSEVYFSEVKYILSSHFLWKKVFFQNNHESLQMSVKPSFPTKLVLHHVNNHPQTQNWTYHHLLPQMGRLFVADICSLWETSNIAQLLFTSWAPPGNWVQFCVSNLEEHLKMKRSFNFYFHYIHFNQEI